MPFRIATCEFFLRSMKMDMENRVPIGFTDSFDLFQNADGIYNNGRARLICSKFSQQAPQFVAYPLPLCFPVKPVSKILHRPSFRLNCMSQLLECGSPNNFLRLENRHAVKLAM